MLPSPVPADPGWDEDLAWLDRDPVTAAEFEASLDRLCELDEGPGEDEDDGNFEPLTAEELAGRRPPMSCSPRRPPPPGGAGRGNPAPRGSSG
jgi:hypothetical protein